MSPTRESPQNALSAIFHPLKSPIIFIVTLSLAISFSFMGIKYCSTSSHMTKAQKFFEEGDFAGAATEAEAYLAETPGATDGLIMLGDAHAAIAEITRNDPDNYHNHVCAAISAWRKSMGTGYNNNIATKIAVLEERSQDLVNREGKMYGPCEDSEAPGTETGP